MCVLLRDVAIAPINPSTHPYLSTTSLSSTVGFNSSHAFVLSQSMPKLIIYMVILCVCAAAGGQSRVKSHSATLIG